MPILILRPIHDGEEVRGFINYSGSIYPIADGNDETYLETNIEEDSFITSISFNTSTHYQDTTINRIILSVKGTITSYNITHSCFRCRRIYY